MAIVPPDTAHVFAAVAQVRKDINALGIAKDREVTDGPRFKFRGIDTVLDSFSGPMEKAGLLMVPSYSGLEITQRDTRTGKTWHITVLGTYKLYSTIDGSHLDIGQFYGEANDTQDKAITKAQSIALRQAYLQTFVVPLGPEADPENGDSAGYDSRPPDAAEAPATVKQREEAPPQQHEGKPLHKGQENILKARLKSKGITEDDLPEELSPVTTANFNAVLDYVKELK